MSSNECQFWEHRVIVTNCQHTQLSIWNQGQSQDQKISRPRPSVCCEDACHSIWNRGHDQDQKISRPRPSVCCEDACHSIWNQGQDQDQKISRPRPLVCCEDASQSFNNCTWLTQKMWNWTTRGWAKMIKSVPSVHNNREWRIIHRRRFVTLCKPAPYRNSLYLLTYIKTGCHCSNSMLF